MGGSVAIVGQGVGEGVYVMQIGGMHGAEVGWQFWQLVRGAFAVVATPLQPRLV